MPKSEPQDAKTRLIDAAERLFAERGVDAVSVREITREASANVAAVHYHFGSKSALLRAVLDRTIQPLTARRAELLAAQLEASRGEPLTLEAILDAFLRPDLEAIHALHERAPIVARFLGLTYGSPSADVRQFMEEQFAENRESFFEQIQRTLPDMPADEIEWRMRCIVGVIVTLFSQATPPGVAGPFETGDVEGTLSRFIAFSAAALGAPLPDKRSDSATRLAVNQANS